MQTTVLERARRACHAYADSKYQLAFGVSVAPRWRMTGVLVYVVVVEPVFERKSENRRRNLQLMLMILQLPKEDCCAEVHHSCGAATILADRHIENCRVYSSLADECRQTWAL